MEISQISRIGNREINEDSVRYNCINGLTVCVVCDGLGGHDKGEVASRLAVEAAVDVAREYRTQQLDAILMRAFAEAQSRIDNYLHENLHASDMKTTMTMLVCKDGQVQWGHVGDTRLYYFRKGRLYNRTKDHSVPQMLVNAGEIKESEIRFHEDRNRLLKALGRSDGKEIQPELSRPIRLERDTAFLLCTDGFWELVTEEQMQQALRASGSVDDWMQHLETLILASGAGRDMDNYSGIALVNGNPFKRSGLLGLFG